MGEAGAADQGEMLGALDALGGDCDALGAGECDDGADQLGGGRVGEILDEGLVELDPVVRQAGEVGERAVAGAEVVERDADAAGDQRVELGGGLGVVAHQHGLGDLQLEPFGREAGLGEGGVDLGEKVRLVELERGDVDREIEAVRPAHWRGRARCGAPSGRSAGSGRWPRRAG